MTKKTCAVGGCSREHHSHGFCDCHAKAWQRAVHANPTADPDQLRPDREPELRRRWVLGWLANGRGGPFGAEVAPWRCEWHLRGSFAVVDRFLDAAEIRADFERFRAELPDGSWASGYFEGRAA